MVKSLLGETSAPEKDETANDLDLMVFNRELKRKEELIKRERRKEEKEAKRREKLLRRQESLDTSSSTATVGSLAESDTRGEMRKPSKDAQKGGEKDKTIQKLCQKLEEFLVSQEKEREQSLALAKRLALAEEEVKHFQEKERDWEEEKRKGEDSSEDIAKLTQLVSEQMSKLAEQAKLIQDLRVQVEVGRVERKMMNEGQEDIVGKNGQQDKIAANSPTEDFLRQTKERVEELFKEQMEIDDEFEDFNQTSLKE